MIETQRIPSDTASSYTFPLSDPTVGNRRIRHPTTPCRIPLPKIPTTSDRIPMEVVGCLSEVIGLVRIHCRIQWDPRVGFFVLGSISLYNYARFYRKKPINANDRKQFQAQTAANRNEQEYPNRGRPPVERECFQTRHPQASSHMNMKRTSPVVPVLIGPPIHCKKKA